VVIALLARNWGSVLEAGLTIPSLTMGSVLGVFLLALHRRGITQRGALTGMAAGLATMLVIHWTGGVAWPWYVLVGTAVTFTTGRIVSQMAGGNPAAGH
jgi:Na+/proline symporter